MLSVLTSLSLLVAPAAAPQDNRALLEVVPLQHLCGTRSGFTPPPWGSMLTFKRADDRPDLLQSRDDQPRFSIDASHDLLRSLFTAEIDGERLRIDAGTDSLLVLGDAEILDKLRAVVQGAADQLNRPLQVEVALWDATGRETPPAMMDPRQFAQFVANRTPLWRSLAETQNGRVVALDRQRWSRYVRDAETEVAQKSSIGQPVTDAFGEGGRVTVRPHALVGGDDLVLHVQFGLAQKRGPVRTLSTGVPGLPDLEVPMLETSYGACSGRITNGGGLAITMRGHPASGGQLILTVRTAGRTPPMAQGTRGLAIFPCGALTSNALTQRLLPPSPYPLLGDEEAPGLDIEEEDMGYLPPTQLEDLVRSALGAEADAEGFAINVGGDYLFVRGNDQAVAKVEAFLRALQDRLLHAVAVRHSGHLLPSDGSPRDPTVEPTILHEIVFPTMLGRQATLARMLETNVVRDLFVEIAQEASILNPEVDAMQAGSWVRARTAAIGTTQHLQLLAQCAHTAPPQARGVMPTGGSLTQVDMASARTAHDGGATNGHAIDHGDGPLVVIDGQVYRSTLATVVTW